MLNGVSTSVFYHLRSPLKPAGQRLVDCLSKADAAFFVMALFMFVQLRINNLNWRPVAKL